MTKSKFSKADFIEQLLTILSSKNIYTSERETEFYRKGWRSGEGDALAVVFPETLLQLWKVLNICVDHNTIIIMQAAKTGLTEGSTPSGDAYDREVIVINTTRMKKIILLDQGKQVISFPGATLHRLEQLLKPLKRAPHSVIGSSCLGASIVGGIANNSGGALVKRGPAYTELSLFAQVNKEGQLELVNHLGLELGNTPEEILGNLENETFTATASSKMASARDYGERLRDTSADTPARYNADPSRLYEASGCAGKLAVFAVRLDTFPVSNEERVFYLGTNDTADFTRLRKDILENFSHLPEVAEYMHRDIFALTECYGKDTFLMIRHLGTANMPKLFALKGRLDAFLNKLSFLPENLIDKTLQYLSCALPQGLPKSMHYFRDQYEHHLILKMSDKGIEEAETYLSEYFVQINKEVKTHKNDAHKPAYFICNKEEAEKAYLHRFAAAGAAVRYQVMNKHKMDDVLALDIALPRNETNWFEQLPAEIDEAIEHKLYYGHFLCHVLHQDYIVKKGYDTKTIKQKMLTRLTALGIKYPAEHNVGHLYEAEPQLKAFYQTLDPHNVFNPGIGKTPKTRSCCG